MSTPERQLQIERERQQLRDAWAELDHARSLERITARRFVALVSELVERRGWTQAAVARELKLTRQAVSDLLRRFRDA